jgi:hypothetical protein
MQPEDERQEQFDAPDVTATVKVGLSPADKCEHGMYNARYCSACMPQAPDRVLAAAMARRKPTNRIYPEPRTLDASDFMEQNPGERLHAGREFLTVGDTL